MGLKGEGERIGSPFYCARGFSIYKQNQLHLVIS